MERDNKGRFKKEEKTPQCEFPFHEKADVRPAGTRVRTTDGKTVRRYKCTTPQGTHYFSVCETDAAPPRFAPQKCSEHPGSHVIRKGTNGKDGTKNQRYLCTPEDKTIPPHRFTLPLPRKQVAVKKDWKEEDAVRNPHRGDVEAGRGHTATMEDVAEAIQRIAMGGSYAAVGRWLSGKRPKRINRKTTGATKDANKNYWQGGADVVSSYTYPLWSAWQKELDKEAKALSDGLASNPELWLPKVLVLDDLPFFGGRPPEGRKRSEMTFSALVAIQYFQPSASEQTYKHRTRLVRAYPSHTADAYELLVLQTGVLPDVIVSDSSASILSAVRRLQKHNPNLQWVPSAFHIRKQLRKHLSKMVHPPRGFTAFVPGDLADRLENLSFMRSAQSWEDWWRNLESRMHAQAVPQSRRPNNWKKNYYATINAGLIYADRIPNFPRGTGAVEAQIRGQVGPFFDSRSAAFSNIERVNLAADLLTLQMNGQLDNRKEIAKILEADAKDAGGFVPAARSIADPSGFKSLHAADILTQSLPDARREAEERWRRT